MKFEGGIWTEKLGEKLGFLFSYFLFTTILFYALTFLNKLPAEAGYFYAVKITLIITIIGLIIEHLLK